MLISKLLCFSNPEAVKTITIVRLSCFRRALNASRGKNETEALNCDIFMKTFYSSRLVKLKIRGTLRDVGETPARRREVKWLQEEKLMSVYKKEIEVDLKLQRR